MFRWWQQWWKSEPLTEGETRRQRLLDYLSWVLLGASILLLKATSFWLENIYHGKSFVANYALLGAAGALLWAYLVYRLEPGYYAGGDLRARAVLAQFFSIIVLTLFIAAYVSRASGRAHLRTVQARVLRRTENTWASSPYITLQLEGREERFMPDRAAFRAIRAGDTISLIMGKGNTGWEAVYRFIPSR